MRNSWNVFLTIPFLFLKRKWKWNWTTNELEDYFPYQIGFTDPFVLQHSLIFLCRARQEVLVLVLILIRITDCRSWRNCRCRILLTWDTLPPNLSAPESWASLVPAWARFRFPNNSANIQYSVIHLLWDLGWVEFHCSSTICPEAGFLKTKRSNKWNS